TRRRSRARSAHYARDRRRRPDLHDVAWPPPRPAGGAGSARARRVRRSVQVLLSNRDQVRNECAAVCVPEPVDCYLVRGSSCERARIYPRRDPLTMHKLNDQDEGTIDVGRRDVLKTVAASVLAGATSALRASARSADDRLPSAMTISSRPLMTVRIAAARPQQ